MRPVLALALAAAIALPAWAAQEQPADEPEIVVVVTATRIEQPVSQAASDVTVITREQIEDSGAAEVKDLLADVPGLTVSSFGQRGSTTSVFVRGGESDHNLVLVDGVRVNQAGGAFDWAHLTTDNIERIEIIRGPQSALYGSDAITSVIQIFTRRGAGAPTWTSAVGCGEDGAHEWRLASSGAAGAGDYSLSYARRKSDGALAFNNEYDNASFSGAYRSAPREGEEWALTTRYTDGSYHFPIDEIYGLAADEPFPASDPDQLSGERDLTVGLRGHAEPKPWLAQDFTLSFNRIRTWYLDEPNAISSDYGRYELLTRENRVSLEAITHVSGGASVLSIGGTFESEDYDYDSRYASEYYSSDSRISARRINRALYAQEQWSRPDAWTFTAGARYDDHDDFGAELTPRLSAAYWLRPGRTKARATWGRGIKAPSFIETSSTGLFTGNPDLKAERSVSWDVGLDHEIGEALSLSATYSSADFDDMITYTNNTWENIQAARSRGWEATLDWRGPRGLSASAGYTHLDTEVTDDGGAGSASYTQGEPLTRRPRHTYFYNVRCARGPWQFDLTGSIVGSRYDVDFTNLDPDTFLTDPIRVRLDSYHKMDLAASYSRGSYRLRARVTNLLDESYQPIYRYAAPGRQCMLTLERAW